ncbi:YciI family protein [Cellulomonas sp. PhB143]|uniref:YciI family protein n=1 Tax=Cellulomonas sp. PhB143 TaxID=2485186 RepID=UPI000F48C067|nr:YciI family protein [Cellulomonas sp. PhB143]ROS74415.1 hypothetical protein EDF32_2160 [Cellulomonas sp. PhB143]
MPLVAVTYVYPDRPAELDAARPAHRAFLTDLHDAGTLVASGPWLPSPGQRPGALLLLAVEGPEAAEALLEADPFARAGLVEDRTVRAWSPVIGDLAAHA